MCSFSFASIKGRARSPGGYLKMEMISLVPFDDEEATMIAYDAQGNEIPTNNKFWIASDGEHCIMYVKGTEYCNATKLSLDLTHEDFVDTWKHNHKVGRMCTYMIRKVIPPEMNEPKCKNH